MPHVPEHANGVSPAASQEIADEVFIERNGNDPDTLDDYLHSKPNVRPKASPSVGREEMFEMEDLTKSLGYSRHADAASLCDVDNGGSEKESLEADRRDSNSIDQSFTLYTPDEERAVLKTFDRRIVLFIALLYMLSFLDRSSK